VGGGAAGAGVQIDLSRRIEVDGDLLQPADLARRVVHYLPYSLRVDRD